MDSGKEVELQGSDAEMCDVDLMEYSVVEAEFEDNRKIQQRIRVHRCVLAASCPYFKPMFTSHMVESPKKEIYLKVR